ncbi:MAG: hypothetical protein ACNI27_01860 [Desulfovibrio sp.]
MSTNITTENTLILGLAAGYHYGDVCPFLASLEECGYKGTTVLFTSPTTRDLHKMKEHNATILPFEPEAKYRELSYNAQRYPLYLSFLKSTDHKWDKILITDVRDVIFQQSPFSFSWDTGLNITLEDESKTIGTCPFNSHWVRQHMGKDIFQQVKDFQISCSGTTVGDHESVVAYLEMMTDALLPFNPPSGTDGMGGYDQGIHNVLIHTEQLECTRHDNSGPILTLAYKQQLPDENSEGKILNDNGAPAVLVHQYDRKPELFKKIRQKYIK